MQIKTVAFKLQHNRQLEPVESMQTSLRKRVVDPEIAPWADPSALHRNVPGDPAGRNPDGCGLPFEYFAARGHKLLQQAERAWLPAGRAGEGAMAVTEQSELLKRRSAGSSMSCVTAAADLQHRAGQKQILRVVSTRPGQRNHSEVPSPGCASNSAKRRGGSRPNTPREMLKSIALREADIGCQPSGAQSPRRPL